MRLGFASILGIATLFLVVSGRSGAAASAAAQAPRDIEVLAGFGQDTVDLLAFFPQDVRIRAGDTITWKQNSDSPHNVAFFGTFPGPGSGNRFLPPGELIPNANLPIPGRPGVNQFNPVSAFPFPGPEANGGTYSPGEFISSGRLAGIPPTPGLEEIFSFSLTFDTPGTYPYICLTHAGNMRGTVEVVSPSAAGVPSQAEIDARAEAEIDVLLALTERAKLQRANSRSETGPANNTVWLVSAGNPWFQISDERAELLEFLPRDLTVTSGDTVVWGSTGFHSVTFNPAPPEPPLRLVETLPDGTEAIINNPLVFSPAKPAAVYDPAQYFNSGNLSNGQPNGTAWTLTFETPGVYEYYCGVHRDLGMKGSITVVAPS